MEIDKIINLLNDLITHSRENEWVEFKLNNSDPHKLGEYLSALSNSACYHKEDFGYLVFGIEDETHNLVGTSFYPLRTKIGNQELESWLSVQLRPQIDFNIYEFEYEGKHFVLFRVPATRNIPVSFKGEYYIRVGSHNHKLDNHPERERKIWHIEKQYVYENLSAKENVAEDDILDLMDYQNLFKMLRLPVPDNKSAIIDRMIQERIIEKSNDAYTIKNIGALLFANNLENFDSLVRKPIRLIFYEGDNKYKTIKEHSISKGYAVGFEDVIKYLNEHLHSREEIINGLRTIISDYPIIAVRELVANAMIHQDFSITGTSLMFEVFKNRIEITNPGKALVDPLRFLDHNPETRNEFLTRFMRRLNICEERGTGYDKVILECEKYHLPVPNIFIDERYTRITLFKHKPFSELNKKDRINICYMHACLKYVSGDLLTNQSLRERFGLDERNITSVSNIIADTVKYGLIKDYFEESKSKKHAKYIPVWG